MAYQELMPQAIRWIYVSYHEWFHNNMDISASL
jgi:hypothetical protein